VEELGVGGNLKASQRDAKLDAKAGVEVKEEESKRDRALST